MKKIITIFAAISMLAVSCQKEDAPVNEDSNSPIKGKLTATFVQTQTKVSYTVMDYDDDWNWNYDYDEYDYWFGLLPAWEIGDKIIGFDNDGNTYTLTVDSVAEDGVATLSGTVPADGDLHLIYKCGAQASDISAKTLTVDYSNQAGDKTMPAVMLADGTVKDGCGEFAFSNAGAVIGIYFADGLPLGSKVTKVTISGENLSGATITLDGGDLTLTATEKADDAISVDGLDLTVVEDDDWGNVFSSILWIAVPAGAVITNVSVDLPMPTPSTDTAKEGIDYVTIAGKKWAKWNIGAANEKDYGRYFYWGGTIGYLRYTETSYPYYSSWRLIPKTTSVEYFYHTDCTTEAGTYYTCEPDFEIAVSATEYIFDWTYTPFNNGSSTSNLTYFDEIKDTVCPDDGDGNRILIPDYDAAHVSWGGTWRMPASDDFKALINACGGTDGTCTPTVLPSANPGKGIYWVSADQSYIADYTGVAGVLFCDGSRKLFFPAAGSGSGVMLNNSPAQGKYWSSTLHEGGNAISLIFSDTQVKPDFQRRSFGFPIRPISD